MATKSLNIQSIKMVCVSKLRIKNVCLGLGYCNSNKYNYFKERCFLSCHEEKTLSSNEKLSPRPLDSL